MSILTHLYKIYTDFTGTNEITLNIHKIIKSYFIMHNKICVSLLLKTDTQYLILLSPHS